MSLYVEGVPTREPSSLPNGLMFRINAPKAGRVLTFTWHGGAYITVSVLGRAFEVINVWNAGTDTPRIPRTREAFAERVERWIAEYEDSNLDAADV